MAALKWSYKQGLSSFVSSPVADISFSYRLLSLIAKINSG
jgi:hypothetical protein